VRRAGLTLEAAPRQDHRRRPRKLPRIARSEYCRPGVQGAFTVCRGILLSAEKRLAQIIRGCRSASRRRDAWGDAGIIRAQFQPICRPGSAAAAVSDSGASSGFGGASTSVFGVLRAICTRLAPLYNTLVLGYERPGNSRASD